MDRLLDQTCMTYPETYVRDMKGAELKIILESVADNLFNPDPYHQQGGDMVRTGGLDYQCAPLAGMGDRITEMTLANGKKLDADKSYRVSGWATVGAQSAGAPVWDVVAEYLRDQKTYTMKKLESPVLKGVKSNPGISDYASGIS